MNPRLLTCIGAVAMGVSLSPASPGFLSQGNPTKKAPPKKGASAVSLRQRVHAAASREGGTRAILTMGPAAIPHAIADLERRDQTGRDQLIAALALFGEKAKGPLAVALTNGKEYQRMGAAKVVAFLARGLDTQVASGAPLTEEDAEKRFAASYLRSPELVRGLRACLAQNHAYWGADEAARALGLMRAREALPDLIEATQVWDGEVAVAAFGAVLAMARSTEADLVRAAFNHVYEGSTKDHLDEEEMNERVQGIGEVLWKDRSKLGAGLVVRLLSHEDWEVRYRVCEALEIREVAEALPLVKRLVDDEEPQVRWAALVAVGHLGKGEMMDRMIAYTRSEDETDRAVGVYALGLTGSPAALDAVLNQAKDPKPHVRRFVAVALGHLKGDKAKIALKKLQKDPDESVRKEAEKSLAFWEE